MSSLVEQLQAEALDPKVSVTDLLRKALVVAKKLGIEDGGGISEFFLFNPPSSISIEGKEEVEGDRQWSQDFQKNAAKIPDLSRFKVLLREKVELSNCRREDAVEFAFKVLLDHGVHSTWAHPIMAMLAF